MGLIDAILGRIPLGAYHWMVPRSQLGINFHAVSDRPLPHIMHVQAYKSEAMFAADMAYVMKHFEVLSYGDLAASAGRARRSAKPAILITFDDGYTECYSVVRPILLRFGVPCTFFVISDAVDNKFLPYPNKVSLCIARVHELRARGEADPLDLVSAIVGKRFERDDEFAMWMRRLHFGDTPLIDRVCAILEVDAHAFLREHKPFMSRSEIQQLVSDGFTIGGHTRRHPYLYTLNDEQAVEQEIVESCRFVKEITGESEVPFAFPFSGDHLSRDLLERIHAQTDFIGDFFDLRALKPDRPFIIKRMKGDPPDHQHRGESNLPHLMHWVYRQHVQQLIRSRRGPTV